MFFILLNKVFLNRGYHSWRRVKVIFNAKPTEIIELIVNTKKKRLTTQRIEQLKPWNRSQRSVNILYLHYEMINDMS
jgi:hypothetical protein